MDREVAPIVELKNITKIYPGVRANYDISMSLYPGEIHGLLGENGSGKSTLIKILSGVNQPDSGQIIYSGESIQMENPSMARLKGIATVYQEFSLVPTLTVAENIFLGNPCRKSGSRLIDWKLMKRKATEVLHKLEIDIAPDALVENLSVAEQQLVEIAKVIPINAKLLILDEPTTAIGQGEIEALHLLLKRMKEHGVAILYISHRLDEVLELVDTITILKDGMVVSNSEETALNIDYIVKKMVGDEVKEHYPKVRNVSDEKMLVVDSISSSGGARDVSFEVYKGEVFGLGGVIGSGRTEIARAVFGADPVQSGAVYIEGKRVNNSTIRRSINNGIALLPENRKSDGLFFNFTGGPNITSAAIRKLLSFNILQKRIEGSVCKKYIKELQITPSAENKVVSLLSGGNQQKIVIARWLFANSKVVILDEPTQGIDIAAKIAVYNLINMLTKEGRAVILISSDHNELIAMTDRIGIVSNGSIVEIMDSSKVNHTHLVQASTDAISKKVAEAVK